MHGIARQRALLRIGEAILWGVHPCPWLPAAAAGAAPPTRASSCHLLGADDGREGEILAQVLRQVTGTWVREALDHPAHCHVDRPITDEVPQPRITQDCGHAFLPPEVVELDALADVAHQERSIPPLQINVAEALLER